VESVFGFCLDFINSRTLQTQGAEIPPEFEGQIDRDLLARTRDYTLEKIRFGFLSTAFGQVVLLVFLFGGALNAYNNWITSHGWPFIVSGLLFFILLGFAQSLLSLPFDAYRTFTIEARHGFNTTTPGLWLADQFKSWLVSGLLTGLLLLAGLAIFQAFPRAWWFLLWIFFVVFSLFMMVLSPYVIEPWFNKFTLLEDERLVQRIRDVLEKAGIHVSRVFKMDASKRSRHSNAYFTGIGKTKRIVLFDTLLEKMSPEETVAILAHEAGHWKKKHLLQQILISETAALIGLGLAFFCLRTDFLTRIFHLQTNSVFAKTVLLVFLFSLAGFWLTPLANLYSRRLEAEADRFSLRLTGDAASMISALVKLSKENLSNLHPHPWYAFFHYSHPPVVARIRTLRSEALDEPDGKKTKKS
jgi:STE24 endopeptidase